MTNKTIEYISKDFDYSVYAGYTIPGWYFWDETQAFCFGPFDSEEQAKMSLDRYLYLISNVEEIK